MQFINAAAVLIWMFTPFTLAAPAESTETVLTPGGYLPRSSVHEVPAGGSVAHVGTDIHVLFSNKTVLRVSTWTVPPLPITNHGQTFFLFNAMQPAAGNSIAQTLTDLAPAITRSTARQLPAGGAFYTVSCWYTSGGNAFHSPAVAVNPGTKLNSIIDLVGQQVNIPNLNYQAAFSNIGVLFLINNVPPFMFSALALEAFNMVLIADYPAGHRVFGNQRPADGHYNPEFGMEHC
ncbi:hypothetical protein C8J57DRAFT_1516617 [Mycena rebaudengoi]|nr:hypothetical protein C8J57DRAFT_1516617 [Mycena rebaudengoi]